ncbi:hypothetical protein SKAU_G00113760 [Synaphobranchus kaupii]|uniref:Uncharacterized protein n=1 Tax=Synaphobranchus kaupii TaxID=118154 RepID=A0A9Q1G0V0_SYNKA|nr:hypothetical protein SKAU_G00113760 [Synaphobranchus kaupii]
MQILSQITFYTKALIPKHLVYRSLHNRRELLMLPLGAVWRGLLFRTWNRVDLPHYTSKITCLSSHHAGRRRVRLLQS